MKVNIKSTLVKSADDMDNKDERSLVQGDLLVRKQHVFSRILM